MRKKHEPYPHVVDYYEVYDMIQVAEINKKIYEARLQEVYDATDTKPKSQRDVAKIFKITPAHVSYIKKRIEREKSI